MTSIEAMIQKNEHRLYYQGILLANSIKQGTIKENKILIILLIN